MEMADGDRFTPEQAEALSALRDGRNVFLSGNAGTGKSYVLNAFISDLKARNVDFLALAPTGIAALNLTDGSTIHRTLKIALMERWRESCGRAAIRETRHRVCTAPILKSIKEIHR